jgi:hypothetical protein
MQRRSLLNHAAQTPPPRRCPAQYNQVQHLFQLKYGIPAGADKYSGFFFSI